MKVEIEPGKYVVAVSGGVDSVVLLDVLSKLSDVQLVVAHFDHGIRKNSIKDREFVEELANKYKLPFYFAEGRLGPKASEDLARKRRYEFLKKVKDQAKSDAIATAHHRDDQIETAIINLIRGTGRKGLSSLMSKRELRRPLLEFSKAQIISYAKKNDLAWREDETNTDEKYLRNHIRHSVVPKLTKAQLNQLLSSMEESRALNTRIDKLLDQMSNGIIKDDTIARQKFISLPHDIAKELLATWLRNKNITFSSSTLDRLAVFAKTGRTGAKADISNGWILVASKNYVGLSFTPSV